MTKALPIPLDYDKKTKEDQYHENHLLKVAAWMKDDENLLLYDEYDIWQLDPVGKRKQFVLRMVMANFIR